MGLLIHKYTKYGKLPARSVTKRGDTSFYRGSSCLKKPLYWGIKFPPLAAGLLLF